MQTSEKVAPMLTKYTVPFIRKGIDRSLADERGPLTIKPTNYRVHIPQDKLDLLVGATLEDRYYVLSLLGKGGMSLVYKAKDMKTDEIVAVKCLRTQVLGDENVVKRFKREADVLNRLNHPRIVQFFGYGTNKRGQPYFVMDYLIGTSLGEILRTQGALDLGRFQDIFVQVAAAIGHAHKHDAVHRDIKPGNIMLVEKGSTSDYVKIVDFGIAKVTEGTQRLTRLGEVWGSPIYMSPEQCMGTNIDTRTDIYSLGIVMYEALTGEVPFLGRNYADTMMKQISEEPPTFKEVAPDKRVPEPLEQIVMRAIRKKPDERYQSMADLKHDLERALVGEEAKKIDVKTGRFNKTMEDSAPSMAALDVTSDTLPVVPDPLAMTSDTLEAMPGMAQSKSPRAFGAQQRNTGEISDQDQGWKSLDGAGTAGGGTAAQKKKTEESDHPYYGKPIELTGPNMIFAAPDGTLRNSQTGETASMPGRPAGSSPTDPSITVPPGGNILQSGRSGADETGSKLSAEQVVRNRDQSDVRKTGEESMPRIKGPDRSTRGDADKARKPTEDQDRPRTAGSGGRDMGVTLDRPGKDETGLPMRNQRDSRKDAGRDSGQQKNKDRDSGSDSSQAISQQRRRKTPSRNRITASQAKPEQKVTKSGGKRKQKKGGLSLGFVAMLLIFGLLIGAIGMSFFHPMGKEVKQWLVKVLFQPNHDDY